MSQESQPEKLPLPVDPASSVNALHLPEDAKGRIRAEEIFRNQVREELVSQKKTSRIWTFANSPFGILFVSSVVLASFGWLYQKYDQSQRKSEERRTQTKKIATELEHRIDEAAALLASPKGDSGDARIRLDGKVVQTIYPEFERRSLISLLRELTVLVESPQEKEFLKSIIDRFKSWIQDKKTFEKSVQDLRSLIQPLLP